MRVPNKIVWRDGSVFHWPSDLWRRAWGIKYGDRANAFEEAVEAVDRHWREKTVLTKFGEMGWEEARNVLGVDDDRYPAEYEDQAHVPLVLGWITYGNGRPRISPGEDVYTLPTIDGSNPMALKSRAPTKEKESRLRIEELAERSRPVLERLARKDVGEGD